MNIDPVAFTVGPFPIRWYGILIAVAVLIGVLLVLKEARRQQIDEDRLLNVLIVVLPFAFLGARLYYVIFNWGYYSENPLRILALREGGLAIHGGLILGFLAGYIMLKRYGMSFWQTADLVAPSIILGQAIGRWGNFFNQEAYGYPVDPDRIPWAFYIDGAYRHPAFLYESLWDLAVFCFLLILRRKRGIKRGDVFLSYALLYSVGRFFIEGLRTDSLMLTESLRVAQVVSVVVAAAAGGILFLKHRSS